MYDFISSYIIYRVGHGLNHSISAQLVQPRFQRLSPPAGAIYLQPIYYLWQGAPKRDHGGVCFGCTKSLLCQQEIH